MSGPCQLAICPRRRRPSPKMLQASLGLVLRCDNCFRLGRSEKKRGLNNHGLSCHSYFFCRVCTTPDLGQPRCVGKRGSENKGFSRLATRLWNSPVCFLVLKAFGPSVLLGGFPTNCPRSSEWNGWVCWVHVPSCLDLAPCSFFCVFFCGSGPLLRLV